MTLSSRTPSPAQIEKAAGRVSLVHWNREEASKRIKQLRKAGFRADPEPITSDNLKRLFADPPGAIVIDLTRLPSHGRDMALAMRERKSTRATPLIFVEGEKPKVYAIQRLLPDAAFATWKTIRSALKKAMRHPPAQAVVRSSRLAGYSGTPLPKKLGIKTDFEVALVDAPPDFEATLGELPCGAHTRRCKLSSLIGRENPSNLALWFIQTERDLTCGARHFAGQYPAAGVWFIWRKKSAMPRNRASFGEREIREAGLTAGMVDFKVCAVDETWSGLKFTVPKSRKTL